MQVTVFCERCILHELDRSVLHTILGTTREDDKLTKMREMILMRRGLEWILNDH